MTAQLSIDDALAAADPNWKATALQAIEHLANSGRVFTAFDLVELGVPEPTHANHWGAAFNLARRRGPMCERCKTRRWCDAHELLKRSRGGSITDPANIVLLCRTCHEWTESEPLQALAEGWLLRIEGAA